MPLAKARARHQEARQLLADGIDLCVGKKATGKTFETRIWPGVGHQFNNDTSPAYDEAVAVDAWTAALRWFDRYLRPPGASLR